MCIRKDDQSHDVSLYRRFRPTGQRSHEVTLSVASEALKALEKEDLTLARQGEWKTSEHHDDETRSVIRKCAIKYDNKVMWRSFFVSVNDLFKKNLKECFIFWFMRS